MSIKYETQRLILKKIDESDQEFIFKQFSNDEVNKFLFDAEPLTCPDEALDIITFYLHAKPKNQERFIIYKKDGYQPIGTIGYHALNKKEKKIDIGYDLNPDFQSQGYMREALKFLIDFIKNKYKEYSIHACIYKDNFRSIHAVKYFYFEYYENTYLHFRGKDYLHHIYKLDTIK